MALHAPLFLDSVHEPWWGDPTAVMVTLFPSVILQQQVNSVSTRQILPVGPGAFDFVWTHFGSADDGEVIELSQHSFAASPGGHTTVELGGRDVADADHMITETLIRGMYSYWQKVVQEA